MKFTSRTACFPALLLMIGCLAISACGQGGKGKKNQPPPQQPPSAFSGKTMAIKKEVYIVRMSLAEAEQAFASDLIPEYTLTTMHNYTYDNLGRLTREVITTFPQNPISSIPDTGATAFDMQFTFSATDPAKEELAVQQIWDFWWDGATGARQRTVTWENDQEELVLYTGGFPETIVSTEVFATSDVLNAQGYVIRTTRREISGDMIGAETSEVYHRGPDGIRLDRLETPSEDIGYSYYSSGALATINQVSLSSGTSEVSDYHYSIENGVYTILIEINSYDSLGNPSGVRTALELYEQGFCHEATRQREAFQRPNWEACKDLTDWQ